MELEQLKQILKRKIKQELSVYIFLNIFIDYAITVVPFPPPTPLHPAHPLPPTFPPNSSCQEAQRVPKKPDPRRNTPRHIVITLPKIKQKERILEAAREKETVTYKGVPIRLSADFSEETLQARRGWKKVFQVMKGKGLHPRLLYPAKLSFRMEGKIKCFSDKVKLKKFIYMFF